MRKLSRVTATYKGQDVYAIVSWECPLDVVRGQIERAGKEGIWKHNLYIPPHRIVHITYEELPE